MSRIRTLLVTVTAAALMAAGCSSDKDPAPAGDLPAAQDLMQKSSQAMSQVTSVGFALTTEGTPPIPVKSLDGHLLKNGDAEGKGMITQGGLNLEGKFVLLGPDLYFNLLGGYQKFPKKTITDIFDPAAVLDPNRGIPLLLTQAQGAKTESREGDAVKISATLPAASVKNLGVSSTTGDLKGQIWINEKDNRLNKVRMEMTGGAIVLSFSDFNSNPAIKAPN